MISLITWHIINYCKLCNSWRISKLNLQKSFPVNLLKTFFVRIRSSSCTVKEFYPPNVFKKLFLAFWCFFGTLTYGEFPCYLFLLFRTFYAWLFMFDSLEEYSLATDKTTNFTCFKPQYYTRKSKFFLFSMIENLVKPRKTKSRKNLVFQPGQNNYTGWDDFCLVSSSMDYLNGSIIFYC